MPTYKITLKNHVSKTELVYASSARDAAHKLWIKAKNPKLVIQSIEDTSTNQEVNANDNSKLDR